MSRTPPPLPPVQNKKGPVPPPPPSQVVNTGSQMPMNTVQPPDEQPNHLEEADYEVITPKKTSPWLWAIPITIILLLAGGGIYTYFYMQQKHEKEQAELISEQEAEEEARKQREREESDSIARQDSLRLNFTSPDLALFNLKGHVKSVMTKYDSDDGSRGIMMMLFDDKTISFDYDGNCASIASELRIGDTTPNISRSGGYITNVDYYNYSYDLKDDYTFTWSGDHITYVKNVYSNGTISDSYTAFDGNDPTSISHTVNHADSYSSLKLNLTFTITYTDRDEYDNWRKAQVNVTGTIKSEWKEEEERESWDGYSWHTYTVEVPKSETENINESFNINRFIDYHEYVPSEY